MTEKDELEEQQVNLSRLEKAVVYCIKALNELTETGIVEGKPYEVTEEGLESIKDFEPTEEELVSAMHVLRSQGLIHDNI